jgi:hypothetical protein
MQQICSLCNKTYSTKRGLLKHNRNIHAIYCIEKDRKRDETTNSYKCKYCIKEYINYQSRWKHEKNCSEKVKQQKIAENVENVKLENERLLKENMEKSNQIIKLQNKLLKCKRIDNKTFKAVNKILIERSLQNSNNNSNNTISNNTINNNTYQICSLGNEQLVDFLTLQQKIMIMNSRLCSLEKIVEIVHCGEMNQFKNILITNLKDNYAYRYDDSKGYFITVDKNDLLDNVINNRVMDIEAIYDEIKTANKINDKTKKLIQDFLDKMENKETPFYDNETKYDNFKSYKTNRIKILLYNNQDKITKDIAIMISNDDNNNNNTIIENILL